MKKKKAYRPARPFMDKLLKDPEIRIYFEEERACVARESDFLAAVYYRTTCEREGVGFGGADFQVP